MENVKQYYKELGKLLYAIAIADGEVQEEERDELHRFVRKELAHHERASDSSGMNKAFYVDFEFEALIEKHPPLNDTIARFIHFIETNLQPGDDALIYRSIKLMEAVANAYSKNKEKDIVRHVKTMTDSLLKIKSLA